MNVKRVSYEVVRIRSLGGAIEISPDTNGWVTRFLKDKETFMTGYGKDIEAAGQQLVDQLKSVISAIEADLKAFAERNG